jgi:hypothetical protein
MTNRMLKLAALLVPAVLSVGCATHSATPYDYSAFEASNPHSILVLPPVNNSPDVKATFGVYAQVTHPLAEAGYYVLPVAVVNETFKQNGLTEATDIHNVDPRKLQEIFGADAALYMTITQYGSSYNVLSSVTTVAAEGKLVDLRTGALLWSNKVLIVDNGNQGNSGGGILGALVKAAVTQIMNSSLDKAFLVARMANERLLAGGQANGLLYGPRSPNYKGRSAALPNASSTTAPPPAAKPVVTAASVVVNANAAPVVAKASTAPALVKASPVPAVVKASPVAVAVPAVSQSSTAPAAVAPAKPMAPATIVADVAPAPVAVTAPPAEQALAPQVAAAPVAQLSGPEQRYSEVLRRAQAKHAALDPTSNWYRSELYEWVMERKGEFIGAGQAPDVALQHAVALMENR